MARREAKGPGGLTRPRDRQRDLPGTEVAAAGKPPERAAAPRTQGEIAEAQIEAGDRDRGPASRAHLDPAVVDHRFPDVEGDGQRDRRRPRGRRSGAGRRTLGLDHHRVWLLEPDAVHGEPPGEEGQEAVLEDDPVEREVVAPARISSPRPDVAEGKAAKDREPEPFGLEADAGGGGGPIEQRAAELGRGEFGKGQDGDAESQGAGADEQETDPPARTRRHRPFPGRQNSASAENGIP